MVEYLVVHFYLCLYLVCHFIDRVVYLSPLFVSQEAASEKGILEQSEITLVSLTDTTLPDQETTITDEEGPWEEKHPDGVTEEGQKGQETEVTVQLCKRHFIYFMTQDHDHMVWSTNKTYNNNKTMVHSKTQEMLLKQGRKIFKKVSNYPLVSLIVITQLNIDGLL